MHFYCRGCFKPQSCFINSLAEVHVERTDHIVLTAAKLVQALVNGTDQEGPPEREQLGSNFRIYSQHTEECFSKDSQSKVH